MSASRPPRAPSHSPRLAVRAVLLHRDRLLLVNAWKGQTHLWCAPGGGVESHSSLPDNLIREVFEETGLTISVGAPCLVNEFHDPAGSFHQVDIYFHARLVGGTLSDHWQDPEQVVSHRRWVSRDDYHTLRVKPDTLASVAWGQGTTATYDPLEPIVR